MVHGVDADALVKGRSTRILPVRNKFQTARCKKDGHRQQGFETARRLPGGFFACIEEALVFGHIRKTIKGGGEMHVFPLNRPLCTRLQMVADFVRDGAAVADIGTDHAYLPVALVLSGKCPRAVVSDLREMPLENAASGNPALSFRGSDRRLPVGWA